MDISKASNFERFVFDLLGRDTARTRELFGQCIARDGGFALDDASARALARSSASSRAAAPTPTAWRPSARSGSSTVT